MRFNFALIASAFLLIASQVSAIPVYYTFQGQVINTNTASFTNGQQVSYTFMLDKDLPGYYVYNGNTNYVPNYTNGSNQTNYFLVNYVGGDAMPIDVPNATYKVDYHYGYEQTYNGTYFIGAVGSNTDQAGYDMMQVYSTNNDPSLVDWSVGKHFYGSDQVYNANLNTSNYVQSQLTLTSISDTNPAAVPEPSSLVLAGFGLIGLMAIVYKRRKENLISV